MKLSISNIAWENIYDKEVYTCLKEYKYDAIEIAPTRFFDNPYDNIDKAEEYLKELRKEYNLDISSMQSIWYGQQGNIFNEEERIILLEYTKKAIIYAKRLGIKNLVFGNPKNRTIPKGHNINEVKEFFKTLGEFARSNDTTLSIEPNPTIYNTNFLNTTYEAFEFVKDINSIGLKLNVDLGTIIYNNEDINQLVEYKDYINHIHISEPNLDKIIKRDIHRQLKEILNDIDYKGYVSIEMKNHNDIRNVKDTIRYVKDVFYGV